MADDDIAEPPAGAHTSAWVDYYRQRLAAGERGLAESQARNDLEGAAAAQSAIDTATHALEQLGIMGL